MGSTYAGIRQPTRANLANPRRGEAEHSEGNGDRLAGGGRARSNPLRLWLLLPISKDYHDQDR